MPIRTGTRSIDPPADPPAHPRLHSRSRGARAVDRGTGMGLLVAAGEVAHNVLSLPGLALLGAQTPTSRRADEGRPRRSDRALGE